MNYLFLKIQADNPQAIILTHPNAVRPAYIKPRSEEQKSVIKELKIENNPLLVAVFETICANWRPTLKFSDIQRIVRQLPKFTQKEIDAGLNEILKRCQVRNILVSHNRMKEGYLNEIILNFTPGSFSPASQWYKVDDHWSGRANGDRFTKPLPFLSDYYPKGIMPPKLISGRDLADTQVLAALRENNVVYQLKPIDGTDALLVNSGKLEVLIERMYSVVRKELRDENSKISFRFDEKKNPREDFLKKLNETDLSFWLNLVTALEEKIPQWLQFDKYQYLESNGFIHAVAILRDFLSQQKELLLEEERIKTGIASIANRYIKKICSEADIAIVAAATLEKKYEDIVKSKLSQRYASREDLKDFFMSVMENSPMLIKVGDCFVTRKDFAKKFKETIDDAAVDLQEKYIKALKPILLGANSTGFDSPKEFHKIVEQDFARRSPSIARLLAAQIQDPLVVALNISKEEKRVKFSTFEYFIPSDKHYKSRPIEEILGLSLDRIVRQAYEKLTLWQKFILSWYGIFLGSTPLQLRYASWQKYRNLKRHDREKRSYAKKRNEMTRQSEIIVDYDEVQKTIRETSPDYEYQPLSRRTPDHPEWQLKPRR